MFAQLTAPALETHFVQRHKAFRASDKPHFVQIDSCGVSMLFLNPFPPQIMYLDVYVPVFKTACSELTEADHPCTSASAAAWLEA